MGGWKSEGRGEEEGEEEEESNYDMKKDRYIRKR